MKLALSSMRVKNFKAVKDSGVLELGPLTAFIGDNGSGKSSMIEALRFAATLGRKDLDEAVAPFKGFEHLRWKGGKSPGRTADSGEFRSYHPLEINLSGHHGNGSVRAATRIADRTRNDVFFEREELRRGRERLIRGADGQVEPASAAVRPMAPEMSLLSETRWFDRWQFLDMVPHLMGEKVLRKAAAARVIELSRDGSNLSEYLLELFNRSRDAFDGLVEAMQVVIPYAAGFKPTINEFGDRSVLVWMQEGKFELPGWMLSTGTVRVLALLALLRHPDPPPLICIEEIENGLDPRTVDLVVEELRRATAEGRTQVLFTTHSPYLLDLLELEDLVLVEREPNGPPRFDRPHSHPEVRAWRERFTPGRLYTLSALRDRGGKA